MPNCAPGFWRTGKSSNVHEPTLTVGYDGILLTIRLKAPRDAIADYECQSHPSSPGQGGR